MLLLAGLTAPWWARTPRSGWDERLASRVGVPAREGDRPRILLHAVSVGETQALRALVPLLANVADVVVSVTTDTGIERARELYGDIASVTRYPLDFSWSVRRFLDAVRPDAVGLVELELWPQFLGACRRRSIPVGVINGRLSARSFRGYRKARAVVAPLMFERLTFAACQDEAYANRFRALGVPNASCMVTGSMKWDAVRVPGDAEPRLNDAALELANALGVDLHRPVIVAGSTAEGEEALVVKAQEKLCAHGLDVQVVCAPRKPARFDEAAAAMPGCVRRSRPGASMPAVTGAGVPGRFLLDTIGELGTAYRFADIVVLGRSFGTLHGSDPAEPAALGCPVVIGPRHADFETAVRMLGAALAIRVIDARPIGCEGPGGEPLLSLVAVLAELLRDPEARVALGERAKACVRNQQGASDRHAALLMHMAAGIRGPSVGSRVGVGTNARTGTVA